MGTTTIKVNIHDTSKWSENRVVARNRVEKALSQPRVFATQTVYHFSEAACEAIANAADADVRDLIAKERTRLEAISLKEHQTDVQNTFALAAVCEVARGDKSPEELAKIVIDTESVSTLIELFDELDNDAIDRIAAIGNRLTAACEGVRKKRVAPVPPPPEFIEPPTPTETPIPAPEDVAKGVATLEPATEEKPAPDAPQDVAGEPDATE